MLGTALGILGAAASYGLNYANTQSQNQWNLQQWMRENQYNLPINQVSRLRQAGLNPALMYQNGTGSLQSAPSPEMKGVPALDPLTLATIRKLDAETEATTDLNARENEKQPYVVQNLFAENDLMSAQVHKMDTESQDIYMQWSFKNAELAISQSTLDEQTKLWNSEIAKNQADAQLTRTEMAQLVALFNLRKQGIKLSNQEIMSRIKVNKAEAARLNKSLNLMDAQIADYNYNINRNKAETEYVNEQKKFVKATAEASNALAKAQQKYWDDYRKNPSKYRQKTISTSSSREFHGGTNSVGGSNSTSTTHSY